MCAKTRLKTEDSNLSANSLLSLLLSWQLLAYSSFRLCKSDAAKAMAGLATAC